MRIPSRFRALGLAASLSLAAAAPLSAQTGVGVSGTSPFLQGDELSGHLVLHRRSSIVEGIYRVAPVDSTLDVGVRFGIHSRNNEASTATVGVESRYLLSRASDPASPLLVDLALVGGASASFPDWDRLLSAVSLGVAVGRQLEWDWDFTRPTYVGFWVHPRLIYTRQDGECVAGAPRTVQPGGCFDAVLFRADAGVTSDLSDQASWFAALGFGDNRLTGLGASVGVTLRL